MKRSCLLLISLLSWVFALGQNNVYLTPSIGLQRAVSGHFAGIVNNQFWSWGGCDFPYQPCADGGAKKYYPLAYGASVVVPQGTVAIGGTAGSS